VNFLLCDAHRLFTTALSWSFEARGHKVVATLDSPGGLADELRRWPVDICLIELDFEGVDATGAIASIRSLAVDVVVLTDVTDPARRRAAVEAGAKACLDKTASINAIVSTCRVVHLRLSEVTPAVAPLGAAVPDPAGPGRFLTPREREILQALVDGDPSGALAARLGVRPATVRTHIQNVLMKLGVHSRLEAAAYAVEHGLVEPPARDLEFGGSR
jgi:two-component system, NarL family, nitrate/nitrite response regulator NarL